MRPTPPWGAPTNLTIPPTGIDGTRLTINSGLSPQQSVWTLRSAYNVAALNCMAVEHAPILANYGEFLKKNEKTLRGINSALDREFKSKYGSGYIAKREEYQTQVYNYFALPPVVPAFCDAALAVGQELRTVEPSQLETYAPTGLAKIETVYTEFFDKYDQYRRDLAQWNALYGSRGYQTTGTGQTTQPGSATSTLPAYSAQGATTAGPRIDIPDYPQ